MEDYVFPGFMKHNVLIEDGVMLFGSYILPENPDFPRKAVLKVWKRCYWDWVCPYEGFRRSVIGDTVFAADYDWWCGPFANLPEWITKAFDGTVESLMDVVNPSDPVPDLVTY